MLLLIRCLIIVASNICVGFVFGPCFFYTILSILSSFALIKTEGERAGCFALIVFLMYFDC